MNFIKKFYLLLKYILFAFMIDAMNNYFNIGLDKTQLFLSLTFIVSFDYVLHICDNYILKYAILTIAISGLKVESGNSQKILNAMKLFFIINYLIYISISLYALHLIKG